MTKKVAISATRVGKVAQLFEDAKFCIMCGGKLEKLGSNGSQFKTCNEKHGVVFSVGERRDQRMAIVMEVEDEG